MNLNQATDYAFRAVLYLARQSKGKVVEAQVIARHEVVPMRFLLKIMPSLIRAGIVRSQRGVGGGYCLARDPEKITFLDVLEAVEGPVSINRCLNEPDSCSKNGAPECPVHQTLSGIQAKLVQELKSHNFAELL